MQTVSDVLKKLALAFTVTVQNTMVNAHTQKDLLAPSILKALEDNELNHRVPITLPFFLCQVLVGYVISKRIIIRNLCNIKSPYYYILNSSTQL